MTNPKTYYCAWHPEKGIGFDLFTNSDFRKDGMFDDQREIICEMKQYLRHSSFNEYHYVDLFEEGWQVKEVVILEKDEFDKLTKDRE